MSMYRGLATFISDMRLCKTREAEQSRVDKELANVRMAFSSGKMSPYDRKKYVWKLVYIDLLGFTVDFGVMEMIALLSSQTYAEKLVGYMAVSVMVRNTDSNMPLVVQAIKADLASTQDPIQCLALCAASNIGGKALAEEVKDDVISILFSRSIFPVVRKKAALCLLRLTRVNRDLQLPTEEWRNKLTPLLEDRNMGVVLCVVSLLLGLTEAAGKDAALFDGCTSHLLVLLNKLAIRKDASEDYQYYGVACPWLQVKILRLLQQFPVPALERNRSALNELLTHILSRTEITKGASPNKMNAEHCVLFEAVTLVVRQGDMSLPVLREKCLLHLTRFINTKEPNIRYLGLSAMTSMLGQEGCDDAIRRQTASIMFSLKDADISVRRRALGLLFALCNPECAEGMVKDLLAALALADFQFRDELVLKIAILSERHSPNLSWYVDTVVSMIAMAGDHVSDEIWHRVVQVVTNGGEELQRYACSRLYGAVESSAAHETAVKAGAYILAEFGHLIVDSGTSGALQFAAIHQHFPKCATPTKCILLSAYAKMRNLYPELEAFVQPVYQQHTRDMDTELQQRAVEYLNLPSVSEEVQLAVLEPMPEFPVRASHLEEKLRKQEEEKNDKDVWGQEGSGAAGEEEGSQGDGSTERGAGSSSSSSSSSAVLVGGGGGGGGGSGSSSGFGGSTGEASPVDLLGLDFGGSSSAPPAAAAAPPPPPTPVDARTVPVTRTLTLDETAKAAMPALLAAASAGASGKLYQDAHLQVGAKKAIAGPEGTLTLLLGNLSPSTPLVALRLRIPEAPGLELVVGEVPAAIAPGAQARITITCSMRGPFSEPPLLQLSFISAPGLGHAYPIRLPLSPANFMAPAPLAADAFKAKWEALKAPPKAATAAFKCSRGELLTPAAVSELLVGALKVAPVEVMPSAAAGAGVIRTSTVGPSGAPVSVGVLLMVIPDAAGGQFKCAVRSTHETVTEGVMAALKGLLEV